MLRAEVNRFKGQRAEFGQLSPVFPPRESTVANRLSSGHTRKAPKALYGARLIDRPFEPCDRV